MEINTNKYFAFISYKREDEEWAVWFHHELENYHLPATLNGRTDLPKKFRPVFRDIDELKAGNLPEQIYDALATSAYLIVICSPNSAKSKWVNKEIGDFIEIGKAKGIDNVRNIFPFIVDGRPHAQNEEEECFPQALRDLSEEHEQVGGNVNESGRDKAFVKVMAGMLPNVAFDDLWNRYERDKAEEERLKREERERFLRVQSRFVSEKVIDISHDSSLAQCLALEVLPKDIEKLDRPFTFEAERALRQASFQHHLTLTGHTSSINNLSFRSDGKQVASISDDFSVRIWDAENGTLIRVLENRHPFGSCVSYTPDDKKIIGVFGDGVLIGWDTETGEEVMLLDLNGIFDIEGNIGPGISSMAISPNGNRLALSTIGGHIYVMDFSTDETISTQTGSVLSIAFSPDNNKLVSISEMGISIWDLEDGSQNGLEFDEETELMYASALFSPDGKRIAFVLDNIIGLLDVEKEGPIQTFGESNVLYVSVSFYDDGNRIVTVSENGEITIWDIDTLTAIYSKNETIGNVHNASFCVKGNRVGLVIDKNNVVIEGIRSSFVNRIVKDLEYNSITLAYSHDGERIVTTSKENLKIWDVNTGKVLCELFGHSERVLTAAFNPDGDLIVSASEDGMIRVWNALGGNTIKVFHFQASDYRTDVITYVAFCFHGKRVVSVSMGGEVVIWDLESGIKLYSWKHKSDVVKGATISPDEKRIAFTTIYTHQGIYICDIETGEMISTLKGHTKTVNSVMFSPDGKQLFSASDDKTIICWDAESGNIIWQLQGFAERVVSINTSHNGKYIVAVTCDIDKPVVVCDSQTGKVLVSYSGLMEPANVVSFSPNDRNIATAETDGTIVIWSFPPLQDLIDQTRERFKNRPLTLEERKQYYLE